MSDGPFKSPQLTKPWQKFLNCFLNPAYEAAEVSSKFRDALLAEVRSIPEPLRHLIVSLLGDTGQLVIPLVASEELYDIRRKTASVGLQEHLVSELVEVYMKGDISEERVKGCVFNGLGAHIRATIRGLEEIAIAQLPAKSQRRQINSELDNIAANLDLEVLVQHLINNDAGEKQMADLFPSSGGIPLPQRRTK